MDPDGSVAGLDEVDAFLVLVPLFFRNQHFGEGAVDSFHQRVGCQSGPQHQLAGAVQQDRGRVGTRAGVSAAVGVPLPGHLPAMPVPERREWW